MIIMWWYEYLFIFVAVQLEEDFKNFPVGSSPKHIMDEETEVSFPLYGSGHNLVSQLHRIVSLK